MTERQTFVFPKEELEPVFGGLERLGKVKQRIFHLNKLGESLNIKLSFSSVDATLAIACPNNTNAQTLISRLAKGKGRIQRAVGQLLAKKLENIQKINAVFTDFCRAHTSRLETFLISQWHAFFPAIQQTPWIDPPCRIGDENNAVPDAAERLAAMLTIKSSEPIIVLGGAGAGKTALLCKTFSLIKTKVPPAPPPHSTFNISAKGGSASGGQHSIPVFVPSHCLRPPFIVWSALAGGDLGIAGQMESLFQTGRLILVIDSLDENPACCDTADPDVRRFWETVLKNKSVLACREDFWRQTALRNYLESQANANSLKILRLGAWRTGEVKNFCGRLAEVLDASPDTKDRAGAMSHLAGLDDSQLEELLKPLPKTPPLRSASGTESGPVALAALAAMAYCSLIVVHKKGILPKNEEEIKDHYVKTCLQWESAKPGACLKWEEAYGLLTRLAEKKEKRGQKKKDVSFAECWETARKNYPYLEGQSARLFEYLKRLPIWKYDDQQQSFQWGRHSGESRNPDQ